MDILILTVCDPITFEFSHQTSDFNIKEIPHFSQNPCKVPGQTAVMFGNQNYSSSSQVDFTAISSEQDL